MFAEHLNGPRKLCGRSVPCLPANYPDFVAVAQSALETLTRYKWSNGAKTLSWHRSIYLVTIVTAYHSNLLYHCINIHIVVTCNDSSIKWGATRSQICQVSFQIIRHSPAFALHATFKIKSPKGLRNPGPFSKLLVFVCMSRLLSRILN